ncbi:MAG: formimidoylglutamase [Bacteroidota bacterium]
MSAYHRYTNPNLWQGRSTKPEKGPQYWYQQVKCLQEENVEFPAADIALLGYACEEGVRRNQGRVGAAAGPLVLRNRLGKLAWHMGQKRLLDMGDIVCKGEDLEATQELLANTVAFLLKKGVFPIVIGGGHDIAYGHAMGIHKAAKDFSIGIINFDAHFDLRPTTDLGTSGTPFYQLFHEGKIPSEQLGYFAIGIQENANPKELFDIANQIEGQYIFAEECHASNIPLIEQNLLSFIRSHEAIYLTIDLDGFSSAFAPGVSAPGPMGLTPHFVLPLLKTILGTGKVVSCDLAEFNPTYDIDSHTARLAAYLIESIARWI